MVTYIVTNREFHEKKPLIQKQLYHQIKHLIEEVLVKEHKGDNDKIRLKIGVSVVESKRYD